MGDEFGRRTASRQTEFRKGFEKRSVLVDLQVELTYPIADPARSSDGTGELDVL
jgi:hypothetical protein